MPDPEFAHVDVPEKMSQPQHSGLFDQDAGGVCLQKFEQTHPAELLPRHATLWNSAGRHWHQLGTPFRNHPWDAKTLAAAAELFAVAARACEAPQPQHSGLFDQELDGVCLQKFEQVHPVELLPRHAALWNSAGTYRHQLGTPFVAIMWEARAAAAEPELFATAAAACEASQPQHSGLFDQELNGVCLQTLEQVHPVELLPRHAALWNPAGTYWHQLGTPFATIDWEARAAATEPELLVAAAEACALPQPQHSG